MGKRNRYGQKGRSGSPFRITVAAFPTSEVSIRPELDLIKAALLYGDEVTVLSPVTTMFLGLEEWTRYSMADHLELIRRTAPYMPRDEFDPDELADTLEGMDKMEPVLRGRGNVLLRAQLTARFKPAQQSMIESMEKIATDAGVDELAAARKAKLLRIENLEPGTATDLIASCFISSRLVSEGKENDPSHTDAIVDNFTAKLGEHLASGRDYFVFDDRIASLTRSAIAAGVFTPAAGPSGRSVQAMSASEFMARLPTFPTAAVDEVLDIRSALAKPLIAFRGAMVGLAKGFSSAAWEKDFDDELHDAWVGTVQPAVQEIDEAVKENESLLSIAADTAGTIKKAVPGLGILGAAGAVSKSDLIPLGGGAVTVAGSLLDALRERTKTAREIKMQPFYFLYAVDRHLDKG